MRAQVPKSIFHGLSAEEAPLAGRAYIQGLDRMFPTEVSESELEPWLAFPLAGDAMWRRLLALFVGTTVTEVIVEDTPAGRALAALARRRPSYDLHVEVQAEPEPALHAGASWLISADAYLEANLVRLERTVENDGRGAARAYGSHGGLILYASAPLSRGSLRALRSEAPLAPPFPSVALGGAREWLGLARRSLIDPAWSDDPLGVGIGGVLFGPRSVVHRRAIIEPPVAIGAGSRVGPGAIIGPGAVIGAGCFVGEGARIREAVLLDGMRLRPGERVERAVRGPRWQWMGGAERNEESTRPTEERGRIVCPGH